MSLLDEVRQAEEAAEAMLKKAQEDIREFLRLNRENGEIETQKAISNARQEAKKLLDEMEKETNTKAGELLKKAQTEAQFLVEKSRQHADKAKSTILERLM